MSNATRSKFDGAQAVFWGFLLDMPIGKPIPLLNFELLVTRLGADSRLENGLILENGGWDINGETFTDSRDASAALMAIWDKLVVSA